MTLAVAALLFVVVAPPATAQLDLLGTISAPLLDNTVHTAALSGDEFRCSVANIGPKAIQVYPKLFDPLGNAIAQFDACLDFHSSPKSTLYPGESCWATSTSISFVPQVRCRVAVAGGSKEGARVVLEAFHHQSDAERSPPMRTTAEGR
jgi:hypothetical protein